MAVQLGLGRQTGQHWPGRVTGMVPSSQARRAHNTVAQEGVQMGQQAPLGTVGVNPDAHFS
jgi:hypothetical protein